MVKKDGTDKALSAKRESTHLDFKDRFDPGLDEDWCEIIKDVVAIANSGGGLILIGVQNNGAPSRISVEHVLQIDPADITNKLAKYTGEQFDKIRIREVNRSGYPVAVIDIGAAAIPMVFTHPGTYDIGGGKQKTAFAKGTLYFRHSAKSEPANSHDLKNALERELERTRKSWLSDIRKVTSVPLGYRVSILPPEVYESNLPGAQPVRIVSDPNAPAFRKIWDDTAYGTPNEIVIGALKSWRRDRTSYASESDLRTLYGSRNFLELDAEKAECLLESAINRHAPFFFWASLLSSDGLYQFIKRVAKEGRYPAPSAVAKLAYAIGGQIGAELLQFLVANCSYPGVKSAAKKLLQRIQTNGRLKAQYGTKLKLGEQVWDVETVTSEELEKLLEDLFAIITNPDNKTEIKRIDALLYGSRLDTEIPTSQMSLSVSRQEQ